MSQRNLFPKAGLTTALRTDFEAFWAAYPPRRPNPRALAEVAFQAAVKAGSATSAELVAAATAYAAEVKRKGIAEDFIVHARTFLVQQRFRDYLAAPAPASEVSPAADVEHELWHRLRDRMSVGEFLRWIAPLVVVTHTDGEAALLQAPTRFHRDWVRQHHAIPLKAALRVRILDIEIVKDIRQ